jgi:YVTN family beta-propeller protein
MKKILLTICYLTGNVFAQEYLSLCDINLSANGKSAYISAATGRSILKLDLSTRSVKPFAKLPAELTGLTIGANDTLFVTGGGHQGKVWQTDCDGKVFQTLETGHTPTAPVLSPDGKTIYVCNRFDNDVSFIDLDSGKTITRVPVLREPVAADITPDGKWLFVANHNPDGPADVDYVASKISVINTQTKEVKHIKLVNGSEGVRGVKISPDGKTIYATHFMARFLVPTTQLERGWVSTDALSVIDVASQTLKYTVLLDDVDQGFPNPWAIDFSEDAKTLIVTSAGNHEVSLIDLAAMTEKIEAEAAESDGAVHLNAHNNLSFLSGIRKRVKLNGNGPRAIAVKDGTAYVANYFSDTIDLLNLETACVEDTVELNPGMVMSQERQGEIFFNDAALCFQNWLSCATCHPDARTDAMNWDLLNDGMGNPKNVKSMLLAHQTPRAMWLGVRADAETGVRAGIKHIQFAVRPEEDARAIDAYLKSLTPVPSPYLVNGQLSKSAQAGKVLFEKLSCIKCHPAPLFTDLKLHDVKTTKGQDTGKPVDTPTLIEIWRTAPYLHDGRAATVSDLLHKQGHAGILKETSGLTKEQIDDLVEYLLSL